MDVPNLVWSVFFLVYPGSVAIHANYTHSPRTDQFLGSGGTSKQGRLDLLTEEKGGLCLFLQEEYCFYVNQLSIVKNKSQQLQTALQKHTENLHASSPWAFESPTRKWSLPS